MAEEQTWLVIVGQERGLSPFTQRLVLTTHETHLILELFFKLHELVGVAEVFEKLLCFALLVLVNAYDSPESGNLVL